MHLHWAGLYLLILAILDGQLGSADALGLFGPVADHVDLRVTFILIGLDRVEWVRSYTVKV